MENHDKKERNGRNSEHDSAGLEANVFADSVDIKREPDIKWEQEDDVDTIEYTPTVNNLGENFTVKIEKIEPDDGDDDDDETGNMRADRQVAGCSHNYGERTAQMSKMHTRPDKENVERPSTSKSINKRQSTSLPKPKQHKCTECDYVAPGPSILNMHMRKHTGEKPFPCKICSKRFSQNANLQTHMKVHATKDSVHCSQCFKIFATKEEKSNHESVCKRRRYVCFLCHALSSNIANLKRHMRMHSGVRPFQCEQCLRKFAQVDTHFKRHMKICSLPPKFRCSVCAMYFSKQIDRNTHEMKCKRRRYECHLCHRFITNHKLNLKSHMTKHTGERPLKCNLCPKRFARQYNFKIHMKNVHLRSLENYRDKLRSND